MKLFKRRESCSNELSVNDNNEISAGNKNELIQVSVPDIKEYLVREYERVKLLEQQIDRLKAELEATEEIKIKYDAALVTLDAYSQKNRHHE